MKSAKVAVFAVLLIAVFAVSSMAQQAVCPKPWGEGKNVIYPNCSIELGFKGKPAQTQYDIAYDGNGWFDPTSGVKPEDMTRVMLIKSGENWVAPNMRGERHHVIILDKNGNRTWQKLERAYRLPSKGKAADGVVETIDYSNPDGPCVFVK